MGNLSKNFWDLEFTCQSCNLLHAPMHPTQIDLLQKLRDAHGKPLIITSGSRCEHRQGLLREADLSSRVASNSPHVPRICNDGKYYTVASDVACFLYPQGATSEEVQKVNRDFIRRYDTKCRIGWKKYAGRNFLHLDVAYLVCRDYIKQMALSGMADKMVDRILASWKSGVEW